MKYVRKASVVVTAFKYFYPKPGTTESMINHIFMDAVLSAKIIRKNDKLYINTLEGQMLITDGCWIVKGVKDELWVVQDHIFQITYEKAE